MRYALILVTMLFIPPSTTKSSDQAPPQGWLGLGYTYNTSSTPTGRMVWLFVRQIAPGGPADRAGLKTQDLITAINGKKITFIDELETLNFFIRIRQGEHVQLKINRGKAALILNVVAGAAPPGMAEKRLINTAVAKAQRGQH